MIYKSYLVLFICFFVQNLATGMNLHDLSSIEIFINKVHKRAWSYYQVENAAINGDEKEDIFKVIFYDLRKILIELNNMSADSRNVSSSGGLVSFISALEKFDRKNGSSLNSKLSDKLTKILNISETINSYVEPLLRLGADNISDDQDVLQFCPTDANAGQNDQFEYEKQIILKEYSEFIEKLTTEVKYKNRFNTCGLTTSLNQAVFDYFHHIIVTYLKEYVMLYFIDIIDARCLDWNVMPLLITRQNDSLNELSENIKLTRTFLATTNYSIHACDADYRNNTNGKSYYELERLFQTMIIAENELNNKNSCKHNCNLKIMYSYANHPECKQFLDCQYIYSGYQMCFADNNSSSKRYE
ncbi:uncharacterized protein LOC141523930 isoform X2 [Cotesia typhae]|uniref:uncharacterized protein LOC141523930 isoform X2 n=1 Tax=Cotesia typhae TaxID=2053667 RepID=UPI003D689FC6